MAIPDVPQVVEASQMLTGDQRTEIGEAMEDFSGQRGVSEALSLFRIDGNLVATILTEEVTTHPDTVVLSKAMQLARNLRLLTDPSEEERNPEKVHEIQARVIKALMGL